MSYDIEPVFSVSVPNPSIKYVEAEAFRIVRDTILLYMYLLNKNRVS